jgi:hypothetical protein
LKLEETEVEGSTKQTPDRGRDKRRKGSYGGPHVQLRSISWHLFTVPTDSSEPARSRPLKVILLQHSLVWTMEDIDESREEKYGPHEFNNDNFTSIIPCNLSDPISGLTVDG